MENTELLFEGITSIRAVIETGKRRIKRLFYSSERKEKNRKEYLWLCHRAEDFSFDIEICPREIIDYMCNGTTHGGICAVCDYLEYSAVKESDIDANGFYIMLSGVEDPFNFGYAVRSCYAAGVNGIIIPKRNLMSVAGTVAKSSAGASERISIFTLENETDITLFKDKGYTLAAADLRDSVDIFNASLKKPVLCIIGGEKRGISRTVLDLSDIHIAIPYGRTFPESLSAASACAITAFEDLRQNRLCSKC